MKRVIISMLVALGVMAVASVEAQFVAPSKPIPVQSPSPPYGVPRPHSNPDVEGVIPEIIRLKKPWELINPFAPPEYGNGSENTTKDPNDPGKPKGIILFGISW